MRILTLVLICLSTYVMAESSNYSSCCGGVGSWEGVSEQQTMTSHTPQHPKKSAEFYTKGGEMGDFQPRKVMESSEKKADEASMAKYDPFDGYSTDY